MSPVLRVVFLASGEGQLFEATARYLMGADARVKIVGLLTQNPRAKCVERARALGIQTIIINKDIEKFGASLGSELTQLKPDYIILTGFSRLIPENIVKQFEGKICNSHPSLLPKYGGKGMYGAKVHQAVLDAKELKTGITLHIVTSEYDEGPVIAQMEIPVSETDSVSSLEQKVKLAERNFLPRALLKWWERS